MNIQAFYINETGNWELKEYKNIAEAVYLQSVSIYIEVREIYAGVKLPSNLKP